MVQTKNDLTNKRFGRWVVLSQTEDYISPQGVHYAQWLCRCDCGTIKPVQGYKLNSGRSQSCGCLRNELISKRRLEDLTGLKFGKLTVLERADDAIHPSGKRSVRWICQCECGNICTIYAESLKSGGAQSCGCLKQELATIQMTTHNGTNERLYLVWMAMLNRCTNQNDDHYKYYGGRGIKVCDEWKDYVAFRQWAYNSGYNSDAPYGDCTIERYDKDGDYCPNNCGWESINVQANNKSNNRFISFQGETHTLAQWSRITGIDRHTISKYDDKGFTIGEIIELTKTKQNDWRT